MTALRIRLGLLSATIAIAALPSTAAAAESLVPPGNSAATQYTEAVPTAGGPKSTGKPKHSQNRSPDKVLGTHNTERLDAQGPQGHAAAEVAAATAPSTIDASTPETATETPKSEAGGSGGQGGSQTADSGAGATGGQPGGGTADQAKGSAPPQSPSGSSGLGEVIDQATGSSSSGELGLLLPLLIVGVVAWSIIYLLRQRKRPAG